MITVIVDTQTNEFVETGHAPDARYVVKALSRNPNPLLERWDPVLEFVAKTPQETADYATAQQTAQATLTSRQKDVLTTCACAVRGRNVAAWNALTLAQKKAAVFAEADVWRDLRVWAETNL